MIHPVPRQAGEVVIGCMFNAGGEGLGGLGAKASKPFFSNTTQQSSAESYCHKCNRGALDVDGNTSNRNDVGVACPMSMAMHNR